jgi:hypothetical protein
MSTTIPTLEQHQVTEPSSMKFAVEKDKQRKSPDTNIPGLDLDMGLTYPSQSLRFLKPLQYKTWLNRQTIPRAQVPLRVVIVGAGLGGLATSIALARRGHSVLVLEQAHRLGEVFLSQTHRSMTASTNQSDGFSGGSRYPDPSELGLTFTTLGRSPTSRIQSRQAR